MSIPNSKNNSSPYKIYTYIFIFGITILRLLFINNILLSPDETYYWSWSTHIDLSYYDHPPMVAYIIYLTTFFNTLNTEFFVRLGAVLLGSGISFIIFNMGRTIFQNDEAGFWGVVWINLTIIFSLGSVIITPDTPQAFFCVLFLFFLYKALFMSNQTAFYAAGLSLGFALLSKYTAFLLFPSLLLFILLSPTKRHFLRDPKIYIMILISLAVFTPVVFWNIEHNWVSFSFQLSHSFGGSLKKALRYMPEFIGSQFALLTPFLFIGIITTLYYAGIQGIKERKDKSLFLFSFSAPILIFFFIVSFKSRVQGNWPSFAYIPSALILGGFTAQYKEMGLSKKIVFKLDKFKKAALTTAVFMLLGIHFLVLYPPKLILKNTSLNNRIIGWEKLGKQVSTVMKNMDSKNTFIFGNTHQVLSEISFYTDKHYKTYQRGAYGRYPHIKDLTHLVGKTALYIEEANRGRSNYNNTLPFFDTVEEVTTVDITIDGELIKKFNIYKCYNYKGGLINV